MKPHRSPLGWWTVWFTATALLAGGPSLNASQPQTLKAAYQDHFLIGAAINRAIATGNGNRHQERLDCDIALVKEQFNQISPENDLKWANIHPRAGSYDFGPADAYVNFGLSHQMYIVGHTLVWHGQTPGWVFAGTNPPPAVTNADGSRSDRDFGFGGPRAPPVRNCCNGCTTTSPPLSAATGARSKSGTS